MSVILFLAGYLALVGFILKFFSNAKDWDSIYDRLRKDRTERDQAEQELWK